MASIDFSSGTVITSAWLNATDAGVFGVESFGAVGDGVTDDTAAVDAAIAYSISSGKTVVFDGSKTYLLGEGPHSWPAGTKLQTNGCVFRNNIANTSNTVWITIAGESVIDKLNVDTQVRRDRLVSLTGDYITIGEVNLTSDVVQATAESNDFGFRVLGNNITLGTVRISNYDRAMTVSTGISITINRLEITGYVRGLYILDSSNIAINSGYIKTASVNAGITAGNNGVLISCDTVGATKNIYLENMSIDNSGEHAVRIGGPETIRNVFLNKVAIYGAGACGIKVLGTDAGTPTTRNANIQLANIIVEDAGTSVGAAANRCAVLLQFVDDVLVSNLIVKTRVNSNSTSHGIRITSATNVSIVNPSIVDAQNDGINIDASEGDISRVQISGGICTSNDRDGLRIVGSASGVIRRVYASGIALDANTGTGFTVATGGGSIVDCLIGAKVSSNTAGAGACDSTAIALDVFGLVGATPLSGITCTNGSRWSDGTTLNIRKAGAWTAL